MSDYLDGDAELVAKASSVTPVAVGIDALGPGRFLIERLEDAGLHVVFPDFEQFTDAQAEFVLMIERRQLFYSGRDELSRASSAHTYGRVRAFRNLLVPR